MEDNGSNTTDGINDCYLNKTQVLIIRRISLACGGFSFFCCLLILCLVAILKKYRTTTQRVILYLTITITLLSLIYVLHGLQEVNGITSSTSYCMITGFLDQVFGWMVGLAILTLNFDLVVKVVTQNFQTKRRYEIGYMVLIFVVPLTFNWIPFIHNTYGSAGAFCWINNFNYSHRGMCSRGDVNLFGVGLQFGLFWAPYSIIILASIIMYAYALCRLRSKRYAYSAVYSPTEQLNRDLVYSEIRQYIYYTFVLVVTNAVAASTRIVDTAIVDKAYFSLQLLHIIFTSLQGVPIMVIFVLDSDTRKDLFHWKKFKAALFTFFCSCRLRKAKAYRNIHYITTETDSK